MLSCTLEIFTKKSNVININYNIMILTLMIMHKHYVCLKMLLKVTTVQMQQDRSSIGIAQSKVLYVTNWKLVLTELRLIGQLRTN